MLNQKTTYEKTNDGSFKATIKQGEQKVEVGIKGKMIEIGVQPGYTYHNIIPKDKVVSLREFLQEQYDALKQKSDAAKSAMDQFSFVEGADKIATSIATLLKSEKIDKHAMSRRLVSINELARKVDQKINATANFEVIKLSLDKIKEQLVFIDANFKN